MLWVFTQYPSVWSPYFPIESRRKFKEQTLLSRKYPCNSLSSCKFHWFLTVLVLAEKLNLKDWSNSFHHSWLICEHHEKTGTWKLSTFCIHILFLFSPSLHRFSCSAYTIRLRSTDVDMLHQTIWESITQSLPLTITYLLLEFPFETGLALRQGSILCSAGRL